MKLFCIFLAYFLCLSPIAALPLTKPVASKPVYYTDEQLLALATAKGIVPQNADKAYYEQEFKQGNSITLWIILPREKKIALVDNLKKTFLEKEGAKINNPTEYYVDAINTVLHKSIFEDKLNNLRGIKTLFLTIAFMEGDYDNGKNKIELLKNYLGEKVFEAYKKEFPEKYQFLVEMAKQDNR